MAKSKQRKARGRMMAEANRLLTTSGEVWYDGDGFVFEDFESGRGRRVGKSLKDLNQFVNEWVGHPDHPIDLFAARDDE